MKRAWCICGAISQYNATDGMRGPANYMSLLVNHASMTGFVFSDYASGMADAARQLYEWYATGKLKSREDIAQGGVAAFARRCCGCSAASTSASSSCRSAEE